MKVAALISGLCGLAYAATANVYTYDPQSPARPAARNLAPVAARLVLAQRAGVEDYHSADLIHDDVIAAINDYGLRTPLFADEAGVKKAVILLQGEATIASLKDYSSFSVSPIPSSKATTNLFIDLAKQSDPKAFTSQSPDEILALLTRGYISETGHMLHLVPTASEFESLFLRLVDTEKWSITAFTTPSETSDNKAQWGTYELPSRQSILKKRTQRTPEQILTDEQPAQSSVPVMKASNSTKYNTTTPLRGILPACYTTLEHCEKTTRNCTGHGTCTKKYRDPDSGSNGLDCYSCSCSATVVKNANGKKTTIWGGPACQKKDVSVEFWLIALFTVGLMFLVSFAVGSVWEMGSLELPSVIGAGVSGVGARK